MITRSTLTPALAALALAAVPATAQTAAQHKTSTAPTRMMTGEQYAMKAAASDMFDIDSSKLALTKTQRADLRDYANMMIRDHSASTAKLMAATKAATPAIPVKPALDSMQRDMMAKLRKLPAGPAFDNAYIKAQVDGHEAMLAMMRAYAANGAVPSLKEHASQTAPVVAQHLDHATHLRHGKKM